MERVFSEEYFDNVFNIFTSTLEKLEYPLPSVSLVALEKNDPYRVLVSTIISLRTKDSVTLDASIRLFSVAPDIKSLASMSAEEISDIIKPAGFYKRKAENLITIMNTLIEKYDSEVPSGMEDLLSLPGVGLKTASLVLSLGFNTPALCVDCHVHEISNRMGWVKTKKADDTEKELRKIMPVRFWIPLNETLVRYGQSICTPVSPFCSKCEASSFCPKVGVKKYR